MIQMNHRNGLLRVVCGALAMGSCDGAKEKWWHERVHTQITLMIDADDEVRAAVDSLRIDIYGGMGVELSGRGGSTRRG